MSEIHETGKKGEELARGFLENLGYKVLETNWRSGKHELDIICMDKGVLVIVEVKTRRSNVFGEPETAVTKDKQKALIRAANSYIFRKQMNCETRFDIVSVLISPKGQEIHHIIDAFYPTL